MSYATANARARSRAWTRDPKEVFEFARAITLGLRLDGETVLEVFEHPWGWTAEHTWWDENGQPDDMATWEDGQDNKWNTEHERPQQ